MKSVILLLALLWLAGCAQTGLSMHEHPGLVDDSRDKVANEYYRCQPGSGIPRFMPMGGVPEHLQVPHRGNCLR
ncbi:hypothetical protein [Natronospira bacteriovora]|uniref:Lipoprotein n=1 Tax=Natronospira bacteriovora TaxID=3069753 RepID=A0ABU0W7M6_9GAMM|nr:hypothetical protein [Natronospira sp. AB-CW4]MDQ2070038.1 hypothetical protein [Natronospira sp. AB-CW4]